MFAYDYEAVALDGEIYCIDCMPEGVTGDDAFDPIFADSEWAYKPVCCVCGTEHDYMTITEEDGTAVEGGTDDAA